MTLLWEADPVVADNLRLALGDDMRVVESGPAAARQLADNHLECLLVVGADIDLGAALTLTEQLRLSRPDVGVVLVRRRLDVGVLAQALRSGVREVVASDDLNSLMDACQRSLELSQRLGGVTDAGASREGRVVTVFSAKGGVGKTTVSTNLAAELASDGRTRVLLVDLDLAFGDVAIALALVPERSTADVVAMSGHLDSQGLASVVTRHETGLDVLCAPAQPGDADRIPGATVQELLRVARRMYDVIILDTPPAFTEHVLAAFDSSDVSILLATLDIPAVKNLRLTLDTLEMLGHDRDSWVLVLNRSDAKVGLTADDVAGALRHPISVQIPNSLAVPASVNRGVPLVLDEPRHAVSQALKTLAREYVRRPAPEGDPSAQARGGPLVGRPPAAPERGMSLAERLEQARRSQEGPRDVEISAPGTAHRIDPFAGVKASVHEALIGSPGPAALRPAPAAVRPRAAGARDAAVGPGGRGHPAVRGRPQPDRAGRQRRDPGPRSAGVPAAGTPRSPRSWSTARTRSTSSEPARSTPSRRRSPATCTCAAPSTRSSAGSDVASTRRSRWWTPACRTAPVSTRSSRRSPSTAAC